MRRVLPPILAAFAAVVLWDVAVRAFAPPPYLVPSPGAVWDTLRDDRASLLASALRTATSTLAGFGLAAAIGLAVGSVLSFSRALASAIYPLTLLFQMVPLVAIAPLLGIWCGNGPPAVIAASALCAVFPVIANTVDGLRSTDPNLRELFRIHGAGRLRTWWKLELPWAVPSIMTGLRIAAGLAVIGAIVGEYVAGFAGADAPLGIVVMASLREFRTEKVFAAVLLAAAVGFLLFGAVSGLSWLLLRKWYAGVR